MGFLVCLKTSIGTVNPIPYHYKRKIYLLYCLLNYKTHFRNLELNNEKEAKWHLLNMEKEKDQMINIANSYKNGNNLFITPRMQPNCKNAAQLLQLMLSKPHVIVICEQ